MGPTGKKKSSFFLTNILILRSLFFWVLLLSLCIFYDYYSLCLLVPVKIYSNLETNKVQILNPYFLTGFSDAESTFTVSITKDNRSRKTTKRIDPNRTIF
jgi:hypothetical protein